MSVFSHLFCSTTITFASQNSSDLDVGRRPKLKSDEFLLPIIVVIELTSLLCLKPPKKVLQSLAARPFVSGASDLADVWLFKSFEQSLVRNGFKVQRKRSRLLGWCHAHLRVGVAGTWCLLIICKKLGSRNFIRSCTVVKQFQRFQGPCC